MNRVRLWIRSIVLRGRLEREMQDEMADHLDRATARLMARGLSEKEARRAAAREFGNVAYLQEEARYARGGRWLDALLEDSRFALRHFGRRPGTTITILALLALGMSINTALFSFLHSFSMQPPPGIPRAEDLVQIRGRQTASWGSQLGRDFSYDELQEYRRLTDHFTDVAGWTSEVVKLDVVGDDELHALSARAIFVTEGYFPVLGVQSILGAGLPTSESADPATLQVAVIGHAAWVQLFGRDPDVIGSTLEMNGVPFTIVGVAPPRFKGIQDLDGYLAFQIVLWVPLSNRRLVLPDAAVDVEILEAAGRLRSGMSPRGATSAVQTVASRAAAPTGRTMAPVPGEATIERSYLRDPTAEVAPLLAIDPEDLGLLAATTGVLGLLILLVTCTNVSALLTGHAIARRREIAMRLSLGAGRTRVIRQLLTESVLLAIAAGAAALGIVWIILRAVVTLVPAFPLEVTLNWPAAVFTFGAALAVGLLFGLSPALHATRLAIASALKDSTAMIAASRARLQRGLVVAQVAFTQPLIVCLAAALVLVLSEYEWQSPTEHADHIVSLRLRSTTEPRRGRVIIQGQDSELMQRRRAQMRQLRDRLVATPGIAGAVPDREGTFNLSGYSVHPADRAEGGAQESLKMTGRLAAPGYFAVMGIPVVRGRGIAPTDDSYFEQPGVSETAVVIGSDLARRLWPEADPIGRRLQSIGDSIQDTGTLRVVGVVEDPIAGRWNQRDSHQVYLPPDPGISPLTMLIRTTSVAQPVIPTIRSVVQEELPGMAIDDVRTITEIEAEERKIFNLATAALAGAGVLALFLSAIGLYAVAAFAVGQRTGEIAVRMAFGAQARQVVGRFVADGLRLSILGLVAGLPLSLIGLRMLLIFLNLLPSVPLSPVTAMAAIGALAIATAATSIPARRAALVDPAITLRQE